SSRPRARYMGRSLATAAPRADPSGERLSGGVGESGALLAIAAARDAVRRLGFRLRRRDAAGLPDLHARGLAPGGLPSTRSGALDAPRTSAARSPNARPAGLPEDGPVSLAPRARACTRPRGARSELLPHRRRIHLLADRAAARRARGRAHPPGRPGLHPPPGAPQ